MHKYLLFLISITVVACESKPPSQPATAAATASQTTAKPGQNQTAAQPAERWKQVDAAALSEAQQAQLDKAKAAQKELGGTLMKALTTSVAEDGFAKSVEFCRGEAPGIAEKVGTSHGVKIGRTSHKLRNPKNTAPEWAADAVAKGEPGMKVFWGPQDALGVLSPIKLGEVCVNCHGAPDQLADGVQAALKQQYPEDEAIGFAEGDLRGWFWIELGS